MRSDDAANQPETGGEARREDRAEAQAQTVSKRNAVARQFGAAVDRVRRRKPVMIGLVVLWLCLELAYFLDLGLLDYVPFLRWLAFLLAVLPVLFGLHLLARRLTRRGKARDA